MGQSLYSVGNQNSVLATIGLGSCVGLLVYSEKFTYLAHIDMGNMISMNFDNNDTFNCIRLREILAILQELKQKNIDISDITCGIVSSKTFVYDKKWWSDRAIQFDREIDNFVGYVKHNLGVNVNRMPNIRSDFIALDSIDGKMWVAEGSYAIKTNINNLEEKRYLYCKEDNITNELKIFNPNNISKTFTPAKDVILTDNYISTSVPEKNTSSDVVKSEIQIFLNGIENLKNCRKFLWEADCNGTVAFNISYLEEIYDMKERFSNYVGITPVEIPIEVFNEFLVQYEKTALLLKKCLIKVSNKELFPHGEGEKERVINLTKKLLTDPESNDMESLIPELRSEEPSFVVYKRLERLGLPKQEIDKIINSGYKLESVLDVVPDEKLGHKL